MDNKSKESMDKARDFMNHLVEYMDFPAYLQMKAQEKLANIIEEYNQAREEANKLCGHKHDVMLDALVKNTNFQAELQEAKAEIKDLKRDRDAWKHDHDVIDISRIRWREDCKKAKAEIEKLHSDYTKTDSGKPVVDTILYHYKQLYSELAELKAEIEDNTLKAYKERQD